MAGSAIVRQLTEKGYTNLLVKPSNELDLTRQNAVIDFFEKEKPEYVFLAAAKVGGIAANIKSPVEFLLQNLAIQNNVIPAAYQSGVKKLVFLGSSCVYPRECPQPMKEDYLLTGKLEPTNEAYAIAKIAGLKLTEYYCTQYGADFISVMPCNLYGTNDSFDPAHSHVLSALVKKFVDATYANHQKVEVWGSGNAKRELMHVDDCAAAIVFLFENYSGKSFINIGTGEDVTIKELAYLIAEKADYKGAIYFDSTKPDGMPRKCLDVSRLHQLGFHHTVSLEQGVVQTIKEYKEKYYGL